MNRLPPPATGVEMYLAAIHDRLGDILERLGGGQEQDPTVSNTAAPAAQQPTKRTRTRPARG